MTHVVLSLGSNIDREKNIRFAVAEIQERFGELDMSQVYEADSVGFSGPSFLNMVVGFDSADTLIEVRAYVREVERISGRVRGKKSFDSRILDIDVLLFGDNDLRNEGFNIPRDEICKYAYVLKPLSDLYPDRAHPICGQTYASLWAKFDQTVQQIEVAEFSF